MTLEKLRSKTDREKQRYVLGFAITVTLVVGIIWFISFKSLGEARRLEEAERNKIEEAEDAKNDALEAEQQLQIDGLLESYPGFEEGEQTGGDYIDGQYQGGGDIIDGFGN